MEKLYWWAKAIELVSLLWSYVGTIALSSSIQCWRIWGTQTTSFILGGSLRPPPLVLPLLLGLWTDVLFFLLECTPSFKWMEKKNLPPLLNTLVIIKYTSYSTQFNRGMQFRHFPGSGPMYSFFFLNAHPLSKKRKKQRHSTHYFSNWTPPFSCHSCFEAFPSWCSLSWHSCF